MPHDPIRVLFVCTGNICRSPTAEGVFRQLCDDAGLGERIRADSAGMIDYHVGRPPDDRAVRTAAGRGYDLSPLRARIVRASDFEQFDYVLAMDRGHLSEMTTMCPIPLRVRVRMFLEFADDASTREVPDPYGEDSAAFEHALELCELGAAALLEHIRNTDLA